MPKKPTKIPSLGNTTSLCSVFIRHTFSSPFQPSRNSFALPPAATALRALIEQKFPNAIPVAQRMAQPVASGIRELDRSLPNGGFPLGRISVCEGGGGITAILRAACQATIANGERAAWIDGAQTIAGAFWDEGPLLVRPDTKTNALRAADELVRSGGFQLVVLTGTKATDTEMMRLVRAVHDGGGAFVTVTPNSSMAALRLSSRIDVDVEARHWIHDPFGHPAQLQYVRIQTHARALGWDKRAAFLLPVRSHELRLSLESGLADRRGLLESQRVRTP